MVYMISLMACTAIAPWVTTPATQLVAEPPPREELFRDRRARRRLARRLDYAELWSGYPAGGRVIKAVTRLGGMAKPFGIETGYDLLNASTQKAVLNDLMYIHRPRTLLVCPPCGPWGSWARFALARPMTSGYFTVRAHRRAHAQVPTFTAKAIAEQCLRGGRIIMEHPLGSDMLRTAEMRGVIRKHKLLSVRVDQCAVGLRDSVNGLPIRKATTFLTNDLTLARQLSSHRCRGHAEHQVLEGSNRNGSRTRQAENYPAPLANLLAKVIMKRPYIVNVVETEDFDPICCFPVENAEARQAWERDFPARMRIAVARLHANMGHPMAATLGKMLADAGASEDMISCALRYNCSTCHQMTMSRTRRPAAVPRTKGFNDMVLCDTNFFTLGDRQYMLFHVIDDATRFHVCDIIEHQTGEALFASIMSSWIRWAGPPRFLVGDPLPGQVSQVFSERLGAQGTTVMIGAAEASWTRGVVERHGDYLRRMISKVLEDGTSFPDMQTLVSHLCAAKNMMSRIRGYSPSQWVLATQPRLPESLMIEDEADDAIPFRDVPEDDTSEFAQVIRMRDAARKAFVAADTDARLRRAVAARTRPDRLTFATGDRVYYWRDGRWHPQSAVVVSQVGAGHYYVDSGGRVFKVAAEQLRAVSERELQAWQAVRDGHDPGQDPVDAVGAGPPPDAPDPDGARPDGPAHREEPAQSPLERELRHLGDVLQGQERPVPMEDEEKELFGRPALDPEERYPDVEDEAPELDGPPGEVAPTGAGDEDMGVPDEPAAPEVPVPATPPGEEAGPDTAMEPTAPQSSSAGQASSSTSDAPRPVRRSARIAQRREHQPYFSWPEQNVIELLLNFEAFPGMNDHAAVAEVFMTARNPRKTEVSLRDLTPADRLLFDEAKAKEWRSWLSSEAVELVHRVTKIPRAQIMKARWVLTWKSSTDGETKTAKARLCVLGFQDPRLATVETTSPTMTADAEALILQWLVNEGHTLTSGDLKTAFLSGDADPERTGENSIFMQPPADLQRWLKLGPNEAIRLRKAVYGLVDAPRRWHLRLSRALRQAGFVPLLTDSCVWVLPSQTKGATTSTTSEQLAKTLRERVHDLPAKIISDMTGNEKQPWQRQRHIHGVLGVHVDDLLGGGDEHWRKAMDWLKKELEFGAWETRKFIFRGRQLEQSADNSSISISMSHYANTIKSVSIPKELRTKAEEPLNADLHSQYRGLVGALQWLQAQGSPGLAYDVGMLQSKSAAPTVADLMAANKVLRAANYMKDTIIRINRLPKNFVWVIMTDAAHANRPDLSSTSGHLILAAHPNILRGENVPISVLGWNSRKIRRKVRSSLGAECAAMSTGLEHGDLLRVMYGELSGDLQDLQNYEFYLTSTESVALSDCKSLADAVTSAGSAASKTSEDKRLAIELSMIKQRLAAHETRFQWIDAAYMISDVLTKGLARGRIDLLEKLLRTSRYTIKPTKDMLDARAAQRASKASST